MVKKSAGILVYRNKSQRLEIFLVHPGGPFWAKKDEHSWSIPKGEFEEGESPFEAAKREFTEETGFDVTGDFIELSPVKQSNGKVIYTWMVEGDFDPSNLSSNDFTMEWPPKSGKKQNFPEVDKGEWFNIETSKIKIVKGQIPIIEQFAQIKTTLNK